MRNSISKDSNLFSKRWSSLVPESSGMDGFRTKNKPVKAYTVPECRRASENFWECLAQYPPKNLGQIPAALAISGIFEWFSPGQNGSEVWRQITLNSLTGPPTSGPFGPGENRSKMPEIARAAAIWPKLFGGDWGRQPQKFSLALLRMRGP